MTAVNFKPLNKPWVWIFLVMLMAIPVVYGWLGGFKPLKVEVVPVQNYLFQGRSFEGSYQSDTLQQYFQEMKAFIAQADSKSPIIMIFDQEPQGKRGKVEGFIGVPVAERSLQGENWELREIPSREAIRVSKDCHSTLMPNPRKIETLIQEFLEENSRQIRPFNIEFYYPDNRLVIERPLMP